jgi:soluble lytic murein transglycosylase
LRNRRRLRSNLQQANRQRQELAEIGPDPDKKAATAKTKDKKAQGPKTAGKKDNKKEGKKDKKEKKSAKGKTAPSKGAALASIPRSDAPPPAPLPQAFSIAASDVAATKEAVAHARAGRSTQATSVQQGIRDPIARKLVEWAVLRSDNNGASSSRYIAFISANPNWPSIGLMRRRAESMMWTEQPAPQTVRGYFAKYPPLSAKGHFSLARALLAQGDRAGAQRQVREAWRKTHSRPTSDRACWNSPACSADDHKARMNMRPMRRTSTAACASWRRRRCTGDRKGARHVIKKAGNARRRSTRFRLRTPRSRLHLQPCAVAAAPTTWREAGDLILSAPRDFRRRRSIPINGGLSAGSPPATPRPRQALEGVSRRRDAAVPQRDNYASSTSSRPAGSPRFFNDPATALTHFARVTEGATHSISVARGHYWQGRAYEAQGRNSEARNHYQAAAQHPTAYYGQLAGAKLGLRNIALRSPPSRPSGSLEVVRAMELLYAVGQRDMVVGAAADLGDRSNDAGALAAIGEAAARNADARAMLLLGKAALGRGVAVGELRVSHHRRCRTTPRSAGGREAARLRDCPPGKHVQPEDHLQRPGDGPDAGHPGGGTLCLQKFNVTFNERSCCRSGLQRALGAAELGGLLPIPWLISPFVGCNAGRGRIRDWVERYGDRVTRSTGRLGRAHSISETRNVSA